MFEGLKYESSNGFNIITCFLWNMPIADYDNIMIKIISLLNNKGIYDNAYKK